MFVAQNPFRCQLCKSLNLRGRWADVRVARKQMFVDDGKTRLILSSTVGSTRLAWLCFDFPSIRL